MLTVYFKYLPYTCTPFLVITPSPIKLQETCTLLWNAIFKVYVAYIYIILYVLGMANYYENNLEYAFAQLNFSFISVKTILAPFNGR